MSLKSIIKIKVILFFLIAVFFAAYHARGSEYVQQVVAEYGYAGVFVLSIISGVNVAVPIPIIAFLPFFLEAGLRRWVSIFIITFGMTIGDGVGYLIGKIGRYIGYGLWKERLTRQMKKIETRHHALPMMVLFFMLRLRRSTMRRLSYHSLFSGTVLPSWYG